MSKILIFFESCFPKKSTETLKVWNLKCCPIRIFFFLVFLGPSRAQIRKKNKSENFEKFGHFLLPVLRNKAQGLTPSGMIKISSKKWVLSTNIPKFFAVRFARRSFSMFMFNSGEISPNLTLKSENAAHSASIFSVKAAVWVRWLHFWILY